MFPSLVFVCLTAAEPDLCLFDAPTVDPHFPLPCYHDRSDFDNQDISIIQIELCRKWQEHCEMMRGIRGWQNGYWDDCIKRLEWQKNYWELVWAVRENFPCSGNLRERLQLQILKDYLGDELYRKRYKPAYLPEVPKFDPPPSMGGTGSQ